MCLIFAIISSFFACLAYQQSYSPSTHLKILIIARILRLLLLVIQVNGAIFDVVGFGPNSGRGVPSNDFCFPDPVSSK
jgi:hypothetical protein